MISFTELRKERDKNLAACQMSAPHVTKVSVLATIRQSLNKNLKHVIEE